MNKLRDSPNFVILEPQAKNPLFSLTTDLSF
jgi:hypothetical protein